jgi:hypothetical protein
MASFKKTPKSEYEGKLSSFRVAVTKNILSKTMSTDSLSKCGQAVAVAALGRKHALRAAGGTPKLC